MAREDTPGDKRLVAYVISKAGIVIVAEELCGYLRTSYPTTCCRRRSSPWRHFPSRPTARWIVGPLPAPDWGQSGSHRQDVTPRTATEAALVEIWCHVLGRKCVSVHDDFFELGGHSLLAMRVISQMWQVFQVELPLRTMFAEPTLAGLATAVDQALLGQLSPEELERMLDDIEDLSDEQINRMLASSQSPRPFSHA